MQFYSDFYPVLPHLRSGMQVAVDGGAGLRPGNARDAVCSERCSYEFRQRQDRSVITRPGLVAQKQWRNSGQHPAATSGPTS